MSSAFSAQKTKIQVDQGDGTYIDIGEIMTYSFGGSANMIDVTSLESDAKEKRKGLRDSGQLSLDLNLLTNNSGQTRMRALEASPNAGNFRIVFPDELYHPGDPTTALFEALVTEFSTSGGVDDVVKAKITAEITGVISWVGLISGESRQG